MARTNRVIGRIIGQQERLALQLQAPNLQEYRNEQTLRRQIVEAGQQQWEFRFPLLPPTEGDAEMARQLWRLTSRWHQVRSGVLSVGSLGDGRFVVGFSGEESGGKLKALRTNLARYDRMFNFTVAGDSSALALYLLQGFLGSTDQANVCGEVKIVCALWGKPLGFVGMTTLWIGSNPNPHPLLHGRSETGSPMKPCGTCRDHLPAFYLKNQGSLPKPKPKPAPRGDDRKTPL